MKLGDKVRDKVTGFEGTVVGMTEWLDGPDTAGVQGPLVAGEPKDPQWFNRGRLEVVVAGAPGQ